MYLFGNILHIVPSITHSLLASPNRPPATLQRDMRARVPPAGGVRYAHTATGALVLSEEPILINARSGFY